MLNLTCAGVWGQICIILWDAAFANLMQNWTRLTFFTICRSFISQVNLLRWNSFNHCNTMLTTEENSALVTRRSNGPCMYVTTYNCQVKSEINTIIFVMIEGVVVIINTFFDFSMWLDQLLALSNLWVKVESQNGLEHSSFSIFTALEISFGLFIFSDQASLLSFSGMLNCWTTDLCWTVCKADKRLGCEKGDVEWRTVSLEIEGVWLMQTRRLWINTPPLYTWIIYTPPRPSTPQVLFMQTFSLMQQNTRQTTKRMVKDTDTIYRTHLRP